MAKHPKSPSRPLWRGHLKLSLVSCPIALYNAISESEDIHMNFLNPETGNRIHYQAIDSETEQVVERRDLVRGYQFEKDRYVTLTDDEIDELKIESSSVMNIESLGLAMKLIDQKTSSFDPSQFVDRYEARLRQLIEAKLKGVKLQPAEVEEAPNVVNLMDTLKRSLQQRGRRDRSSDGHAPNSATIHRIRPKAKAAHTRKRA